MAILRCTATESSPWLPYYIVLLLSQVHDCHTVLHCYWVKSMTDILCCTATEQVHVCHTVLHCHWVKSIYSILCCIATYSSPWLPYIHMLHCYWVKSMTTIQCCTATESSPWLPYCDALLMSQVHDCHTMLHCYWAIPCLQYYGALLVSQVHACHTVLHCHWVKSMTAILCYTVTEFLSQTMHH